ncbi:MAG TPA: hypothetical protein VIM11_25355 [Tepidisphaeraceae bacterium]|jgi:hypothetical protein
MSAIITTHVLSEEVISYCEAHNLLNHLETALRLADECFKPIENLEVSVEPDPEVEGVETVVIDIWIRASVEVGLAQKSAYTKRWITSVPADILGRIALLFYLI